MRGSQQKMPLCACVCVKQNPHLRAILRGAPPFPDRVANDRRMEKS